MKIQVLCDNVSSWIVPYAKQLVDAIIKLGNDCCLIHNAHEVQKGDILFLLSCEQIYKNLHLNKHNLVVHESALPLGKGWSPLTWQVLEGKSSMPVTLFEAEEKVDAGLVYFTDNIQLDGTELVTDLRRLQGEKTIEIALKFLNAYPNVKGEKQIGESTFYPKREPKDSELNIHKSIAEEFNLLRVCDNEKYPAFFYHKGKRYKIKIEDYE